MQKKEPADCGFTQKLPVLLIPWLFFSLFQSAHKTMTRVPAPINTQPISDLAVNSS